MPAVNFGKFSTLGNKTVASGLSSGLNTHELVESLVKAREIPINKLTDKVDVNNKKLEAFDKLHIILDNLKDACKSLRKTSHFYTDDNDVFDKFSINVLSNDFSDSSNYISVTPTNAPEPGKFKISNIKLAYPETEISEAFPNKTQDVTSETPERLKFKVGKFYLNDKEVVIDKGDSLQKIHDKINKLSNVTGVRATIIKSGYASFELMIQSKLPGEENAFVISDPEEVLVNIDFTIQNASNASMKVNGRPITRLTNVIDDVIDGVVIYLRQDTPENVNLSIEVKADIDLIIKTIDNFVNSYNDLMMYHLDHHQRDPKTKKYVEDAVLGGDTTLNALTTQVYNEVMSIVIGMKDEEHSMLDHIGIKFTKLSGEEKFKFFEKFLDINVSVLKDKLITNFAEVRKIFQFDFYSSSESFLVNERSNDFKIHEFSVEVGDLEDTESKISFINSSGIKESFNAPFKKESDKSGKIIGEKDSPLDGITVLYYGEGNEKSDIKITHGIADRLYILSNNASNLSEGVVYRSKNNINESNKNILDHVEKLSAEVNTYRERLIHQYGNVEKAVSQINSVLQMLDAQDAARRSSN